MSGGESSRMKKYEKTPTNIFTTQHSMLYATQLVFATTTEHSVK